MPPRPFPVSLSLGIDICRISRLSGALGIGDTEKNNHKMWKFLGRLLTWRERVYLRQRFFNDTVHSGERNKRMVQFLAGRWAAKEACIKAVKPRKLTLQDIEIWPDEYMESYALILDEAVPPDPDWVEKWEKSASRKHTDHVDRAVVPDHGDIKASVARVSISHEEDYAVAVAMADQSIGPGDVGGEAAARRPDS